MQKLHDAGYKTVSLFKNNTNYMRLNSLDYYMIDLLMMIESKWLFEWGTTGIHQFVNDKLKRGVIPGKYTYLDNVLLNFES